MNIVVTGASRGIGFHAAKSLAAVPGNRVMAVSRSLRNLEALEGECNRIQPGSVICVAADFSSKSAVKLLAEQIFREFKLLDILVNNAAVLLNKKIWETTDEELETSYRVNLFSVYGLTRDLLPLLKKTAGQRSHVVNIGSMGGIQGSRKFPGLSVYSSGKAAVCILTECMAEELDSMGISVNCLAFGSVQTKMLEEAFPGLKSPHTASDIGSYLADFALNGHKLFNGKVIQVATGTP